jgi:hypothetical protein
VGEGFGTSLPGKNARKASGNALLRREVSHHEPNRDTPKRNSRMKKIAIAAAAMVCLSGAAEAKGCIKGAVVGGVAGHYAGHHGVLGAAAGCVIGRHEAKKHAREEAERRAQRDEGR